MATQEFIFNVPFRCYFNIAADIDVEAVKDSIQRCLDFYQDGRRNLERECMERDMDSVLKSSIEDVVYELVKNKMPGLGDMLTDIAPMVEEVERITKTIKYTNVKIDEE